MVIPPLSLSPDQLSRIFLLQVDHTTYNTPENTRMSAIYVAVIIMLFILVMVHMTCESYGTSAQQDLLCAVKKLFLIPEESGE